MTVSSAAVVTVTVPGHWPGWHGPISRGPWVGWRTSSRVWCRTERPQSCDLGVFVYQPAEQIATSEASWDGATDGSNDLSGAAWLSARCGRRWLKCATYSVSTAMRWRRLMISIRSSSSRRTVPAHRSAIAFAPGCPHRRARRWALMPGEVSAGSAVISVEAVQGR